MPKPKRADREVSAGGVVFRRVAEGLRFLIIRDSYAKWGLPKGHLENGEPPAAAALRETEEEVGLTGLVMHGPIRMVDWRFRAKGGRYIHKFCHFFLLESPSGDPVPQLDEGITAARWCSIDEALADLSYDNARGVLRRAGEMAQTLFPAGQGRPHPMPHPIPRPIPPT